MAKGNRKNKAKEVEVQKPQRLMPLSQMEAQYFEELKEASNDYSKILTQQTQFEHVVAQLQKSRKKIQDGEIKMPINLTLIPKVMTYPEGNKKEILKIFDETIKNYLQSLQAVNTQVEYRYETFIESGIRNREYFNRRFQNVTAKKIAPARTAIKDESTLFEAELDKLIDPKKREAAKKDAKIAMKKAVEHNKKLAKAKVSR